MPPVVLLLVRWLVDEDVVDEKGDDDDVEEYKDEEPARLEYEKDIFAVLQSELDTAAPLLLAAAMLALPPLPLLLVAKVRRVHRASATTAAADVEEAPNPEKAASRNAVVAVVRVVRHIPILQMKVGEVEGERERVASAFARCSLVQHNKATWGRYEHNVVIAVRFCYRMIFFPSVFSPRCASGSVAEEGLWTSVFAHVTHAHDESTVYTN